MTCSILPDVRLADHFRVICDIAAYHCADFVCAAASDVEAMTEELFFRIG
jgi:hypothetical protein